MPLTEQLKPIVRRVLASVLYHGWYRWRRGWDCSAQGQPLLNGITAVVSARNEEFMLPFCLRSLVGVADQVVCIDNGSDDGTLEVMRRFREECSGRMEVTILQMPGALLGDCRNAGLSHTRYRWHLRWDADMVCRTSGPDSMVLLRDKVLRDGRPRTIQLPRLNLRGDFHHTRIQDPWDPGEPILMRFGRDIRYVEDGKFDVIRVPFYYKMVRERKNYYYHCEGLKSQDNMIHRRQYFEWREAFNAHAGGAMPPHIRDFGAWKPHWCLQSFGTADPKALKWRINREDCHRLIPTDPAVFGEMPDALRDAASGTGQRYRVIHRDGRPYYRTDATDREMEGYTPTPDDLAWERAMMARPIR